MQIRFQGKTRSFPRQQHFCGRLASAREMREQEGNNFAKTKGIFNNYIATFFPTPSLICVAAGLSVYRPHSNMASISCLRLALRTSRIKPTNVTKTTPSIIPDNRERSSKAIAQRGGRWSERRRCIDADTNAEAGLLIVPKAVAAAEALVCVRADLVG